MISYHGQRYLYQLLVSMNALIKHSFLNAIFNNFLLEYLFNAPLQGFTIHVYQHK